MKNVELELLTNPVMYLVIEKGLLYEISMICHRFRKTNNLHIPDYGPKQESSYVVYLNVNNLYAWGMSQPLPTGEFDSQTIQEIASLDIPEIKDDEESYILETDLHIFHTITRAP